MDLFCKAGGATKGLQRAGFYVIGVDIEPQPHYCGDEFIQADALTVPLRGDFIWAGPVCKKFTRMTNCRPGVADKHPDQIAAIRARLLETEMPYVIENVPGAPLILSTMLCGQMFGLPLYRHRLFECSFCIWAPEHPKHKVKASRAGHWEAGTIMSVSGNFAPVSEACKAMGIHWMTRDELSQAIPPAYSEYIGKFAMQSLERAA